MSSQDKPLPWPQEGSEVKILPGAVQPPNSEHNASSSNRKRKHSVVRPDSGHNEPHSNDEDYFIDDQLEHRSVWRRLDDSMFFSAVLTRCIKLSIRMHYQFTCDCPRNHGFTIDEFYSDEDILDMPHGREYIDFGMCNTCSQDVTRHRIVHREEDLGYRENYPWECGWCNSSGFDQCTTNIRQGSWTGSDDVEGPHDTKFFDSCPKQNCILPHYHRRSKSAKPPLIGAAKRIAEKQQKENGRYAMFLCSYQNVADCFLLYGEEHFHMNKVGREAKGKTALKNIIEESMLNSKEQEDGIKDAMEEVRAETAKDLANLLDDSSEHSDAPVKTESTTKKQGEGKVQAVEPEVEHSKAPSQDESNRQEIKPKLQNNLTPAEKMEIDLRNLPDEKARKNYMGEKLCQTVYRYHAEHGGSILTNLLKQLTVLELMECYFNEAKLNSYMEVEHKNVIEEIDAIVQKLHEKKVAEQKQVIDPPPGLPGKIETEAQVEHKAVEEEPPVIAEKILPEVTVTPHVEDSLIKFEGTIAVPESKDKDDDSEISSLESPNSSASDEPDDAIEEVYHDKFREEVIYMNYKFNDKDHLKSWKELFDDLCIYLFYFKEEYKGALRHQTLETETDGTHLHGLRAGFLARIAGVRYWTSKRVPKQMQFLSCAYNVEKTVTIFENLAKRLSVDSMFEVAGNCDTGKAYSYLPDRIFQQMQTLNLRQREFYLANDAHMQVTMNTIAYIVNRIVMKTLFNSSIVPEKISVVARGGQKEGLNFQ